MIPTYLTPVLVTGTVTTIPSGTQNVYITGPSPLPVTGIADTAAIAVVTRVASSTSNHMLVAANPLRKGLLFYNDSTAYQYVKLGTVASGLDFTVRLVPQVFYEVAQPIYLGQIDAISSSSNGAVQITELQ